jgi:type VI secretion system protein ImpL
MKKWLILAASIAAVLILCVIIWFVFPAIGFGESKPFESLWLRLFLILLTLAGFFGWQAYKFYKRANAAKEIEHTLTAPDLKQSSDSGVLSEKMNDAIQTLKASSKSKGNFLYELPWYVMIGPPGAGKTTALLNSGLKFPLLGAGGKAPVSGTGGTRYCDWWFTEDAVFIDTAGRYTTQDSDADADKASWMSFLDLLKKNRPRQPINGVMVAIGIDDIAKRNAQELSGHAQAVRRRLSELHERLQVDFPVYILFTKADLMAGFMEFFGHYDEAKRKAVWGATFQTADKKQNKVMEAGGEIDVLVDRLLTETTDRLHEEADPMSRVKLFGLPSQLATLKPAITDFLTQVFEPTRYQQNAAMRGFYFTSGTQEGTPIDNVLGSMSGAFGLRGAAAPAYSGREKSFFLGDLLTKVILGEAGWVTTNAGAIRRGRFLRLGSYGAIGLASLAMLAGWWASYASNSGKISATDEAVANYEVGAAEVVAETPIADADFQKIEPHLSALKTLPAGYANTDYDPALLETLGLNQHGRLNVSAVASYRHALDRMLRSRMVIHMEKRLSDLRDKPELLYEPLKVYMMLGGDPNVPVEAGLIEGWMRADWEKLYPGEPNRKLREDLQQHLQAMLHLNPGTGQIISLNGDLIKASQKALLRLSLAERAFALLKSTARSDEVKDWVFDDIAGPDGNIVFETADGATLDQVRIPAIFTYDGFYKLFLDRRASVIDLLKRERWLLGEEGQSAGIEQQFTTVGPDLHKLYEAEFMKSWVATLERIRMHNLSGGSPDFPALAAASGVNSPVKRVIESIAAETKLTEARPQTAIEEAAGKIKDAAGKIQVAAGQSAEDLAKLGLDAAQKSDARGGEAGSSSPPGAEVQAKFRRYHDLAAANKDGKTQIDVLIAQFRLLHQSLVNEQNPELRDTARQNTLKATAALASSATRLEAPFSSLLKQQVEIIQQKIVGERVSGLENQVAGSVTSQCKNLEKLYPFSTKARNDAPIGEFAKLFGPNGSFDSFFRQNLAGLVDTSGKQWEWKPNTKLGQGLSDETLRQFQNAARIRDAFFTGQGSAPNVKFSVTLASLSQQAQSARLEVNGQALESVFGTESQQDFEWPGNSPDGTASISLPEVEGRDSVIRVTGPWAFHRLLNAGSIKQSGNKMTVRYVIGGREVVYRLTLDTVDNPFILMRQLKFSCPEGQ